MADKNINQLPEVTAMGVTDLFVLEQSGDAKKLTGQLLKTTLLAWLDGHGGIKSIDYNDEDYTVTITTEDGTSWTTGSLRGAKGKTGDTGPQGETGPKGFSPLVSVSRVNDPPTPGNMVNVTTESGMLAFLVPDGTRGASGTDGASCSMSYEAADATEEHPNGGYLITLETTTNPAPGMRPVVETESFYLWNGSPGIVISSEEPTDPNHPVWIDPDGDEPLIKSAYVAAQDGGYTGTEAQFNTALAAISDKANKATTVAVSLPADGWDADAKTQTVAVTGVTETANCIVTAAPASYVAYGKAWVRCTAQGAGTLTFTCETVPTEDLTANVLILG